MRKLLYTLVFVLMSVQVTSTFAAAESFQILMNSSEGDYIGGGKQVLYSNTTDDFITIRTGGYDESLSFEIQSFSLGTPLTLTFEGKNGRLSAGLYDPAKRYPFNDPYNGIDIGGDGKGCNTILGKFYVHEIEYNTQGQVTKAAIDFVQKCEETMPALYGSIRYNSSIPVSCGVREKNESNFYSIDANCPTQMTTTTTNTNQTIIGPTPTTTTTTTTYNPTPITNITPTPTSIPTYNTNPTNQEARDAATVLYQNTITKLSPEKTPFDAALTRWEAALLLKRFAVQFFNSQSMGRNCSFNDIGTVNSDIQSEIIESCQIGLFKGSNNKFNPRDNFTRGQIIIVIGRLLSSNPSMELDAAYDSLLGQGIIKVDDRASSSRSAPRQELYIMLNRILNGNTTPSTTSTLTQTSPVTQIFKIKSYKKDANLGNYQNIYDGSAVLVGKDTILTNAHVILDEFDEEPLGRYEVCQSTSFTSKPTCFSTAKLLYYNQEEDLALLQITNTKNLPNPVEIASNEDLTLGEVINVYGYPGNGGTTITRTQGTIAGFEDNMYKIDAQIDEGNSGGGGFNKAGELVGIPSFIIVNNTALGYMIPVSTIKAFLNKQNVTTYTQNHDTSFDQYISTLQSAKKSNLVKNSLFEIKDMKGFSITERAYNSSKNPGEYVYSLSSPSNKTYVEIGSVNRFGSSIDHSIIDSDTIDEFKVYFSSVNQETITINGKKFTKTYGIGESDDKNSYYATYRAQDSLKYPIYVRVVGSQSYKDELKDVENMLMSIVTYNEQIQENPGSYKVGALTIGSFSNIYISQFFDCDCGVSTLSFRLTKSDPNSSSNISFSTETKAIDSSFSLQKQLTEAVKLASQSYTISTQKIVQNKKGVVFGLIVATDGTTKSFTLWSYIDIGNNKLERLTISYSYEGNDASIEETFLRFVDEMSFAGTPGYTYGTTPEALMYSY